MAASILNIFHFHQGVCVYVYGVCCGQKLIWQVNNRTVLTVILLKEIDTIIRICQLHACTHLDNDKHSLKYKAGLVSWKSCLEKHSYLTEAPEVFYTVVFPPFVILSIHNYGIGKGQI